MPIFNSVYKAVEGWKPGSNTIGYWKLNGNLNDEMGNYNGYVTGGGSVSYVSLPGDSSVKCAQVYSNGWSSGIGLPNSISNQIFTNNVSFSFGAFVKTTNGNAELWYMQSIGSNCYLCLAERGDNGSLYFDVGGSATSYSAGLSTNTRHSVEYTYNHTTRVRSLYADGVFKYSTTMGSNYSTSSTPDVAYLARINANTQMSNMVFEKNVVWDAQGVKRFHDTFKSLYGIS